MVRLVCALLLLAVATASASPARVVGGAPVSIEQYPSIIQIQRSLTGIWRQNCAGAILTSQYIITAAGCFNGPNVIIRLRRALAGSSTRNGDGQISGIARVVKHPSWNEGINLEGDIAVVQLETPLQYSQAVQQASILGQGVFVPDNMPAVQTGWGLTLGQEFPSLFSEELRALNVATVNNDRCIQSYATYPPVPLTVTSNMICASSIGESGACIGDRGGPLYVNDIVVGLVSWGLSCTNSTFPTVHTAIPSYTDWIIANVV